MKRLPYAIAGITLGLAFLLTAGLYGQPQAQPQPFPNKLLTDIRLPQDGRDFEFVRHYMSGNSRIRKDSFTIWSRELDSLLEYRKYREDERTACSEKRYPPDDFNLQVVFDNYPAHSCGETLSDPTQKDLGLLRRLAIYDTDGQSFVKHEVRRKDGTLERLGERQRDGRYHIRYYFSDGVTVHRDRYFIRRNPVIKLDPHYTDPEFLAHYQKKQFKLTFERVFRKDGTTPESLIVLVDGSYSKSLYNENGERIATIKQDDGVYKNGDVYSPDGKTLVASYTRSPWMSEEQYFRPDGTLEEVRLMYMGSTEARFFDGSGRTVLYRQVWRDRPETSDGPARSILSRLHIYDDSGGREILIRMVNDGTSVDEVSYQGTKTEPAPITVANSVNPARFKKTERVKIDAIQFHDSTSPAWIYDYEDNVSPVVGKANPGVMSE